MTTYNVVVTPVEQYNNPNSGEVRILFYYDPSDPDSKLQVPPKELFKSQGVWITSGYEEHITKKFVRDDLFLLTNIEPTQHNSEEHTTAREYHDWAGRGSNVQRLNNQLIPILNCGLPNKDSGVVKIPLTGVRPGIHFIQNEGKLYGPFEIEIEKDDNNLEIIYVATAIRPPSVHGTNDHVTVVDMSSLETLNLILTSDIAFGGAIQFITSLKEYGQQVKSIWEEVDYISAKKIFKNLQKVKSKNRVNLITKKMYQSMEGDVTAFVRDKSNAINSNDERYNRALALLSEMQGKDEWFGVIDMYMQSESGKDALSAYQKVAPKDVVSKEQLDETHHELRALQEEIEGANNDHNTILAKLQTKQSELSNIQKSTLLEKEKATQSIESSNQELKTKRSELLEEIEQIEQAGLNLKEKYKTYQTKEELEEAIKVSQGRHDDLRSSERVLSNSIAKQKTLLASPDELAASLTTVHTVMESLGYAQYSSARGGAQATPIPYCPKPTAVFDHAPSASDLIVTLTDRINHGRGRQLSPVEVANLLICSQQHIMVFLKGRPGVGKTSTTIKFAEALGIKTGSSGDADFLNVPVGRGWSSSRDLLGYYNSLRGEFQPSKSGVYEFLKNGESPKAQNARIILLDEANLSSIEHYWSDFIGICDPEGADRPIITGSSNPSDKLLFPNINNNLRFISTINSDATVEPLSSRLLDRAPVISMELSNEQGIAGDRLLIEGAISNQLLEDLFGRKDPDTFEASYSLGQISTFVRIGVELSPQLGNCLYIDGRRQNNIEQYLATASHIFENDVTARDFAVAQFVLPHLNCDGNGMEDAIKAMIRYCDTNSWDHSKDLLNEILLGGDKYLQHYSFL